MTQTENDSNWLAQINTVLIGTSHAGNIGAAARALKTMGLRKLHLVAPLQLAHPQADAMASHAADVLAQAEVHDDLGQALKHCQYVLGCTARERRIALPQLNAREAAEKIRAVAKAGGQVAVLFGRERTGLENHELQQCHAAVHIPANPAYSSLNLAAAVQVMAYELRMAALADDAANTPMLQTKQAAHAEDVLAEHAQVERFFAQLATLLDAVDFHKGRNPDAAMHKLRRLFLRANLQAKEVRILRGILTETQRMLKRA